MRLARGLLALAVSVILGGCSLVLDFGDACKADTDCEASQRCDHGLCVARALVGPDVPCRELLGADPRTTDPNTVWLIGSLLPKSGAAGNLGPPMEQAVEMAVDEINQSGGILGKKVGVVACDSGTSPDIAAAAARHLVDVAKVDVIIGAAASSVTIDTFTGVAKDARVLMVSPASTSPAISNLPDEGLLWRTAPSDAVQGQAIARYLVEREYGKIAVVNRDDAYGNGLSTAIQRGYCVPPRECKPNTFFNRIYEDDGDDPLQGEQQANIAAELALLKPDVVVLIGFLSDGVAFLNLASGADFDIVLTDGMKDVALLGDRRAGADPTVPGLDDDGMVCRLVGTNPASPGGAQFDPFALKFDARFKEPPGAFAANSYDAMYAVGLAYAAAVGAGSDPVDGRALALGLTRLSAGTPIAFGVQDWGKGVTELSANGTATVDVTGVSGPLDFDAALGEAISGIELWRLDVDAGTVVTLGVVLDADGVYVPGLVTPREGGDSCLSTP